MDSNYIITPSGTFVNADELYHWGIKGMKWGVRRYQNPDGSLTAAGRKRYINSDGSLTKAGKKYYAKETERLKAEKKKLNNEKRTTSKLSKLETMRKANEDLKKQLNSKKDDDSDTPEPAKPKQKLTSDMDDRELQDRVNRLRNEDAYRDLSKKLGYEGPKTELDYRIAEMEKQKKYLELQRDIKNLTPQKVSKGKQVVDTLVDKAIIPAVTGAGKEILQSYLTNAGMSAVKKSLAKTMAQADADVKRAAAKEKAKLDAESKKQADKQAKKDAKQQAKEDRKEAKQQAKEEDKAEKQATKQGSKQQTKEEAKTKVAEGTVEGTGNSSRKTSDNSSGNSNGSRVTYDQDNVYKGSDGYYHYADTSVTDLTTTRNTSAGRSWVSGYLSAPKDDDD